MALLFQTTYNAIEQTQADGGWVTGITGLGPEASWYPNGDTNYPESITSAANYSAGGGGRGQRHWYYDGLNAISGGTLIDLGGTRSEFWIRGYIRFQLGFSWGAHTVACKLFYPVTVGGDGTYCAPGYHNGVFGIQSSDEKNSTTSWATIMGGSTSDGQHKCYEYHVKADTNGSNGIAQGWLDGVELMNITNANWGTPTGWSGIRVGENHGICDNLNGPIASAFAYVDFDDIVVSNSGYIGPLGSSSLNVAPETGFALCLMQRMGSRSRISKR